MKTYLQKFEIKKISSNAILSKDIIANLEMHWCYSLLCAYSPLFGFERVFASLFKPKQSLYDLFLPRADEDLFLATDGEFVLGTLVQATRDRSYIWGMYVSPSALSAGIGSSLLSRALAALDDNVPADVQVIKADTRAVSFYQKFGFTIYHEEKSEILPNIIEDIFFMELLK